MCVANHSWGNKWYPGSGLPYIQMSGSQWPTIVVAKVNCLSLMMSENDGNLNIKTRKRHVASDFFYSQIWLLTLPNRLHLIANFSLGWLFFDPLDLTSPVTLQKWFCFLRASTLGLCRSFLFFSFGLFQRFPSDWHMDAIQNVLGCLFGNTVCGWAATVTAALLHSPPRSPTSPLHNPTCCRLSRQSCLNDLHKRLLYSAATLPFVALPGVSLGGRLHTNGRRGEDVGTQDWDEDEDEEEEEEGKEENNKKEKRRQILLEHGCRAGRMRKHARKRRAGTRQTVGYAGKRRKAFGNLTSTLARSADRLLRIQAFCQEGAPLCCVELCCVVLLHR